MAELRHDLILASGSSARRALLTSAGLKFDVIPADIDERAVKDAVRSRDKNTTPAQIAAHLAAEKARAVSLQHPRALVLGADQVLAFEGGIQSKVADVKAAHDVLAALRGKTHELVSAAALARRGEIVWQTCERAKLSMRNFSDSFLEAYLAEAGAGILDCVGCYKLEGLGVQLFDKIEGDYFTILGLPLVGLLGALRRESVVAS